MLKQFLEDTLPDNNDLSRENITIIKPGNPGWNDDDDDNDDDISNLIIDVFVITLPQQNISTILQTLIS